MRKVEKNIIFVILFLSNEKHLCLHVKKEREHFPHPTLEEKKRRFSPTWNSLFLRWACATKPIVSSLLSLAALISASLRRTTSCSSPLARSPSSTCACDAFKSASNFLFALSKSALAFFSFSQFSSLSSSADSNFALTLFKWVNYFIVDLFVFFFFFWLENFLIDTYIVFFKYVCFLFRTYCS